MSRGLDPATTGYRQLGPATLRHFGPGVTGQSIPPAGLHPGLKRFRLDYTRAYYGLGKFIPRVYYGLGQFIPPQAKLYTHNINHDISSVERYAQELFNFSTSYAGFSFVR